MASVRYFVLAIFRFLSNIDLRYGNSHLSTKFDRNRIIHCWDMSIKLFSKWRCPPSWIFQNSHFGHVICICVRFWSNFHINRPICRRDTAKNDFQCGVRLPSWNCKISIFLANFHLRNGNSHLCTKLWLKSDNSRLSYGDKAIFKMAAVHHLEFSKIVILVMWPISARDSSSPVQISH